MNERLIKLAEQAGMTDDKYGMFFALDKHNEDGVDLEKFAELLVQECIDIVDRGGEFVSRPKMVERLREHFGVEE